MTPKPQSCREVVDLLGDYLEGNLSGDERRACNAHLVQCPSCVSYTQTYVASVRLGRAALRASAAPVPADVPGELVRAILAARGGRA